MNTSTGLTAQGVAFSGGRALLPWEAQNISWDGGPALESKGSLDANLAAVPGGVVLRGNASNRLQNGYFNTSGSPDPWSYFTGPTGEVNATWDPLRKDVLMGYRSPSTQTLWDPLDNPTNWGPASGNFSISTVFPETTRKKEGAGALGDNVALTNFAGAWAGAQRSGLVTWSGVNRLTLWVYLNASAPLSLNLSALAQDGRVHGTRPQPLFPEWQEMTIDLSELGSNLANLSQVTLRVNGQNVPQRTVIFDDIRVGLAKEIHDTGDLSQHFFKANTTPNAPGNALLSFDWVVVNASSVDAFTLTVNVTGLVGGQPASYNHEIGGLAPGPWQSFVVDLSTLMAGRGNYTLYFQVLVAANTTAASDATLRLDNVTLVISERSNGTYLSGPVSLGTESRLTNVTWGVFMNPPSTEARLRMRTGNTSDPGAGGWSPWWSWSGALPLRLNLSALAFQIAVDLNKTNASVTPMFMSFALETWHRTPQGSLVSRIVNVTATDFLRWRDLHLTWVVPANTSLSMYIGDGTFWTPVTQDQNLSAFSSRTIRWQASLTTSDGLMTPSLIRVDLVYDFLGPIARVVVSPSNALAVYSGSWIHFRARAFDVGNHLNASTPFVWSTDDPAGRMYNNGSYQAGGKPGTYNVTASAAGSPYYATVQVTVMAVPTAAWTLVDYLPYVLTPVAVAVLGFAGYQVASRRLYAIDDVFLISRDGRLLMHNTRRMRADRDEDVLSGMLTAMISFLRDWDPEENGKARRFDYGDKVALLEHGEHVYVAAVYKGRVPGWATKDLRKFVSDLEATFGESFAKWSGSPEDLHGVREFMQKFVARFRYHGT